MLYRPEPFMNPDQYKTYSVSAPVQTHTRVATCQEVECSAFLNGWVTRVDVKSELGARQAKYIRNQSGRHFVMVPIAEGASIYEFKFPAGQRCFRQHRVSLDRPAFFRIQEGDWRWVGRVRDVDGQSWLDDFGEHQERLADVLGRG